MLHQTKKIIETGIFIFASFFAKGQYENQQLPKFMPPPPNAFQITKSADVNVGLNTGTANISIPLFDISAGGTKIPLTLNYSSNGVTVDEIASRTGINWTLNIGGVISRTVMDEDDEYNPLKAPPANINNQNDLAAWAYPMMPMGGTDWNNTQPDEYRFNVNGLSGKFFYDHTNALKLSSFSDVKIEKNGANAVWKFKITDPNGIVYYFGGPNATEKSKYQNPGCARGNMYNSYSDVAYYVNKIEFPNGENIVFNYTAISYSYVSNVTQTFISTFLSENEGANGGTTWGSVPGNSATTCQSEVFNMGVVLNSVVCSNGTNVTFGYINREDIVGEKALRNILLSFNGAIVSRFLLTYTYSNSNGAYEDGYYNSYPIGFGRKRMFLVSVANSGRTGYDYHETVMTYNDMDGMPPRLSTAQDHFGYFNGQHNALYVPVLNLVADPNSMNVDEVSTAVKNNLANTFTVFQNGYTGNKEPSFNHAVKGTLQSIRYPTGGTTSIEWESNTVNKDVTTYPAPVSTSIYALGTCSPNAFCAQTVTRYITTGFSQYLSLAGAAGRQGEDTLHSSVFVYVTDLTHNYMVFSRMLKFNESFSTNVNLQGNATFKIELISTTSEIPGSLTYECRPGNVVFQNLNAVVPGLRVKKITDNDGINNTMVKKYLYYKLSDPAKSSGQNFNLHYFNTVVHEVNTGGYWGEDAIPYVSGIIRKTYNRLQGTSNYRSYLSGGNTINYTGVVESLGENFENGGTEHIFGGSYNAPGQIIYGNEITGSPYSDNSNIFNGLEQQTTILKKSGTQLVPVSKTVKEYSIDSRNFSWYNSLVVQSRNNSNTLYQYSPTSHPSNLLQFDIMAYPRYVSWVHLDKITNYVYDDNANEFKTEKSYTYGSTQYSQPTEESNLLSDNTLEQTQYKYVKDYNTVSGLSSNSIAAANLMISKNIIAPQLEKKVSKNSNLLATTRTDYKVWNNNMPLPEIISSAFGSTSTLEPKIRFNKYDATGKVNELSKENDVKITYLWGYNNLYPILEATNATTDEIFYTSFETDNVGVTDNNAKTGFKVAATSYTVNFTPPNSKQYTITYNTWDGTKWNFTEQLYTGNSFTITASKIDEVRVYPKENVLITTHTYWPLVGTTSICDPNNKVAHYSYDAFNRLSYIRDEDGNVLKKICYNYIGQQINCNTPCLDLTPNWLITTTALRCQKNSQGLNTGNQEQEQRDMNSCSPTYQQTRWIEAGYNEMACPPNQTPAQVNLTSTILPTGYSGYTATYYNVATQVEYTFNVVNASGLQSLGTVPEGAYMLTISRTTGTPLYGIFRSGCFKQTVSGTSAIFYNVNVSPVTCNSITIDLTGIE